MYNRYRARYTFVFPSAPVLVQVVACVGGGGGGVVIHHFPNFSLCCLLIYLLTAIFMGVALILGQCVFECGADKFGKTCAVFPRHVF